MAIERVREALLRFHAGEFVMPAKVYLESPPFGDFRAMPALGDGLALLKWVTSFPGNPEHGLPTVTGVICISDATTGEPLMLLDARSVTALRTGAVAAVAALALAPPERKPLGSSAAGSTAPGPRAASPPLDSDPACATTLERRPRTRWRASSTGTLAHASRHSALLVVCCVTPGSEIVVDAGDLHPGLHLNMLGADGPGKAEASVGAVASCALFCDEWEQASHGGELTGVVQAGLVSREQVTELGAVLAGDARGRPGPEAVTLFDSTGLAIQDLAVAAAALDAWRAGRVEAQTVSL